MKNRLIAHRGDMTNYAENSMQAIQAAIDLGFVYIEIDVQLSKDLVPIVMHDDTLMRTANVNKKVFELTGNEIISYSLNSLEDAQVNKQTAYVPALSDVINLLNGHPEVTLFVEIKRHSIEYCGLKSVVEAVLHEIIDANFKVVVISFLAEVVDYLRERNVVSVGWAIGELDQLHQQQAITMKPEYLFCDFNKIKNIMELWQGTWQWVLYDIKQPQLAYELLTQGVSLVETGDIIQLASAEQFA